MLEFIVKGLVLWFYDLILECVGFIGNLLLEVFSMDTSYFVSHAPVVLNMQKVLIAVGWALLLVCASPAYAVEDMWTVGREIITDIYSQIAGISTVLAGLMSAVAVLGCKFSGGRQQRVDQSWDWLKRIWIAWAVINGIGAFIAYVAPLFSGLATLEPGV